MSNHQHALDLSHDDRRHGLAFANRVEELAMDAPDVVAESILHAAAHRLRRRFGYSRDKKKSEIVRRVKNEPLGIRIIDLKRELGFHIAEVYSLIHDLEREGKIARRKVPPAGRKGGRPAWIVTLSTESR